MKKLHSRPSQGKVVGLALLLEISWRASGELVDGQLVKS